MIASSVAALADGSRRLRDALGLGGRVPASGRRIGPAAVKPPGVGSLSRRPRLSRAVEVSLTAAAVLLLFESLVGTRGTVLAMSLVLALAAGTRAGHPGLWSACALALLLNTYVVPEILERVGSGPGLWTWFPLWCLEGLLLNWLLVILYRGIPDRREGGGGPEGASRHPRLQASTDPLLVESSSQSQERFRLMVESIGDYAIVLLGPDGRIASWNVGAERIFGYREREVLGKGHALFFDNDEVTRGIPDRCLARAAAEGGWQLEAWRRRKDGARFWSHVGFTPLRHASGKLLGFASVIRDITDRKRAEESLRQARDELEIRVKERTIELAQVNRTLQAEIQERLLAQDVLQQQSDILQSTLDSIGDAIIVAEGHARPLRFNPAARALFRIGKDKYTLDEWLHMCPFRSVESNGLAPVEDAIRPLRLALQGERIDNLELIVLCGDPAPDEMRWVLATARPLHGQGSESGAVVAFRDITDRRRQAQELRDAKEAAESASHAKDQFLAILSHELRTPLTPVLLAASDLRMRADLAPDVLARLEMIERNSLLEARLIDDLLDLTRASTGRLTLALSRVDVHDVIGHAVEVCRAGIEDAGIELALDLAAAHHHLEGDPARLQQVYWNLVKNSIKFTPRGGRITIRSWNPSPASAGCRVNRICTEVSDTGVGIEPGRLPGIFNAFEPRDTQMQRLHGGLGLGLAISRSVVLAHGGSLLARSDGARRGAAFTVELAALPAAEHDASPPEAGREAGAAEARPMRLRILLVDDNRDTLRDLAGILERHGHAVTPAASYTAASRLVEQDEFDLLISDIELPDGTGLDLIRDLRGRRAVPAIALSGFGSADDIMESRNAGFDEHLIKPIDVRSLHAAIARVTAPGGRGDAPPAGRLHAAAAGSADATARGGANLMA